MSTKPAAAQIAQFVSMYLQGSSELTRLALGWMPDGPGLIEDLSRMNYAG